MIGVGTGPTNTTGTAPSGNLTNLLALAVKLWAPLVVTAPKDYGKKGPGMIMHIIGIALEKLVQEHIEWKTFTIL
jgi:hypothetical protein